MRPCAAYAPPLEPFQLYWGAALSLLRPPLALLSAGVRAKMDVEEKDRLVSLAEIVQKTGLVLVYRRPQPSCDSTVAVPTLVIPALALRDSGTRVGDCR